MLGLISVRFSCTEGRSGIEGALRDFIQPKALVFALLAQSGSGSSAFAASSAALIQRAEIALTKSTTGIIQSFQSDDKGLCHSHSHPRSINSSRKTFGGLLCAASI
jgi:hypothetical protein